MRAEKKFINHLIFPKSWKGILYRFYICLIPLFIFLRENYMKTVLTFRFVFLIFEGIFFSSHYHLSDIRDFQEDIKRKFRWEKLFFESQIKTILTVVALKLIFGFTVIYIFNQKLLFLATSLILLQISYDSLLKRLMPIFSIAIVALGYLTRIWAMFIGLNISHYLPQLFGLTFFVFFHSFYMGLCQHKFEVLLLYQKKLFLKPGLLFFKSKNLKLLSSLIKHSLIISFVFTSGIYLKISTLYNTNNFTFKLVI